MDRRESKVCRDDMDLIATPPATADEDPVRRLEALALVRPDDLASHLLEFEKGVEWGSCRSETLDRLADVLERVDPSYSTRSLRSAILVARDWQDCLGSLTALQTELRQFHDDVESARERRQILPSDLTPELDVLRRIVSRRPDGEDTGTPNKVSNTNDPYSRFERDTTSIVHALEAKIQPIKASLGLLLLRLDAFGHHAESLMPEAVASAQIAYAGLCVKHETASQEFERLKAEFADDKWLAVWHCVERQVREIVASVSLTLRRLDSTAFRGTLINGSARALAMKREHYTVLVPALLALLGDGIRSARCRNREVVQGFRDLERTWEQTAAEVDQMTRRIEAARAAGIIYDETAGRDFARPEVPATPFRKDTSFLPPRSQSRLSSAAFDSPTTRPPWNGGTSVRLSNAVSPSKLPARVSVVATPAASRLAMPTQSSLARSVSALPRPSTSASPQKARPSLANSRTPTKPKTATAPRASLLRPPSTPLVSSRMPVVEPATTTHSTSLQQYVRPKSSLSSHVTHKQTAIATPTRPVLKPTKANAATRSSHIPLPSPVHKRPSSAVARVSQ